MGFIAINLLRPLAFRFLPSNLRPVYGTAACPSFPAHFFHFPTSSFAFLSSPSETIPRAQHSASSSIATDAQVAAHSAVIACGPFSTTENLAYEPLQVRPFLDHPRPSLS